MATSPNEGELKSVEVIQAAPTIETPLANSLDEKTGGEHSDEEKHEHHHHHPHVHLPHHLRGRRLLSFVHPHTGKHTHVAHTPDELERKVSVLSRENPEGDFDVLLHGSGEHIDAIRGLHAEREAERDQLYRDNEDIYKRFEHVRDELDVLNSELHVLTDHSVALDASFDKFGYSAHLRTTDSETASLNSNAEEKHRDRSTNPLKFFKRPQIRQYFHKGLLWRSSKPGEVASFELFIDLVYVGVIDIIGEQAAEHPSGLSLLHFVISFCIGWKIWSDMTSIINWFDIEDIFQRICVAFYLVCLFGFTTNIAYMFPEIQSASATVEARAEASAETEYHRTYTMAIAFFIAQRLFVGLWFFWVGFLVPMIKGTMTLNAVIILVSSAFWIGSIHVSWPNQLALIFIAIFIDLFGGSIVITVTRMSKNQTGVCRHLLKYFEFAPAINIEHRVERNNAFIALVFGYSILTILYQSSATMGINDFFGKGVLGLIQAFCFNWIYFEIDNFGIHVHAIRRHWFSATLWVTAHLPFIMSYILAASTLTTLVLAHDSADTNESWLGSHYVERSVVELEPAMRWFYCGGIGLALIFMGVISLCHTHKKLKDGRLHKRPRLAIRTVLAIIIIVLPTAGDRLTSLDLVAITCSITVLILIIDLYGNSAAGTPFWTHGLCPKERKQTTYVAHCRLKASKRRELQRKLAKGEDVGIGDVLRLRMRSVNSSASTFGNASGASLGGMTVVDEERTGGGGGEKGGEGVRRRGDGGGVRGDEEWLGGTY